MSRDQDRDLDEIVCDEGRIACALERLATIGETLISILNRLVPKQAQSATIRLKNSKGELNMDISVHISDVPQVAQFTEFTGPLGTGIKVPPVGAVTFVSDHPEFVTVDTNSGQLAYIAAGVANITGTDAGNSLTASGSVTVSADVAVSAVLSFAPPAPKA